LTVPAKNRYAYKLEGLDKDWVFPGNRRFASYTNIDPGKYVFKVKGSNNDGLWNEAGIYVPITITPPYWETWWFRLLVGTVLISLAATGYNYRVSKLLELERLRVRIASDLHDDIGSSLSGIALVTDSIQKQTPLGDTQKKQLADVSIAARHTADALRDIVWLVKPEHEKLDDIVLRMKDSTAKLLVGIDYAFHCDGENLSNVLDMEFRRHLLLIYKEILNNIAKHSRAGEVEIRIDQSEKRFRLSVTDNGVGFDETTVRRGSGLDNMRKRAVEIGGTVRVSSKPGEGTTIEIEAQPR
jgi:signal transduction histidine kinase